MDYINTAYLFKCQTCRHFRSDECNTFCENGECYSPNMRMIPTADVVEVVRCRGCMHCEIVIDQFENDWYFCKKTKDNAEVKADHFCSYGERRDS